LILMHSPLVGPATWEGVALQLLERGVPVLVPSLHGVELDASAAIVLAARVANAFPHDSAGVVVAAHSGAGPLVPMVAERLHGRLAGAIFVDASLPADSGSTPLADPEFSAFLDERTVAGQLPPWTDWFGPEAIATLIPNTRQRSTIQAECRPISRHYFSGRVPVPPAWASVPCSYLQLSLAYAADAQRAHARSWPVEELKGHHLLMVTDPSAVAEALLRMVPGPAAAKRIPSLRSDSNPSGSIIHSP
jgi:hypothetical protein